MIHLSLGDGPGAAVLAGPEGPSEMDKENLELCGRAAEEEETGGGSGHCCAYGSS